MGILVQASPKNSVKLVEKDLPVPNRYAYVHPSRTLFIDSLQVEESAEAYLQPICYDDFICLQFRRLIAGTAAWNYAVLDFYDANGQFLGFIAQPTHEYTLATDLVNGEQAYRFMFLFKPSDYAFLNGQSIVSIVVKIAYGDGVSIGTGTLTSLVSNPIRLATEHPGTRLIEYSNDVNDLLTLFEFPEIFPKFQFRVPGSRMKLIPAGDYDVAEDMGNQLKVLHSNPYNKWKVEVGPVPAHKIEQLNHAMSCTNIRIDGDEYSPEKREEGDAIETAMGWTEYILRDRKRDIGHTFEKVAYLLWSRPESGFNYGLSRLFLSDRWNFFYIESQAIENDAAETTIISAINTAAAAAGATGEAFADGTDFYFVNGPGQNFKPVNPGVLVFPYELLVTFNVTDIAYPANLALYYPDNLSHYVLMRDATGSGEASIFVNSGLLTSVFKLYGSTGSKTFRIFHRDEEVKLITSAAGSYPKLTNITGHTPAHLQRYECVGANLSAHANFSLSFLARCKNALSHLIIRNSRLQALAADWAADLETGTAPNIKKPFPFELFDLRGNEMDTAAIDDTLNEYNDHTKYKSGPYQVMLQGQSPAAPPSGASATAIADIVLSGQTVQHD